MTVAIALPGGGSPGERVLAFVAAHRDLFGIVDPATELRVGHERTSEGGTLVVLERRHAGLPVFGAEIRAHLEADVLRSMSTSLPSSIALDASEAILDESAIRALAPDETIDAVELGVLVPELSPGASETRRAYRVVGASMPDLAEERFVDAVTGETLIARDAVESLRVYTVRTGMPEERWWRSIVRELVYDDGGLVSGRASTPDAEAAWQVLRHARRWFETSFGRSGWHPDVDEHAYVEWGGSREIPAFFSAAGGEPALFVTPGWGIPDVLAHEYTHGIVTFSIARADGTYVGLGESGESSAIEEALADLFSAFMYDDGARWTIGEDAPGGPVRDLADPGRVEIVGGLPYPRSYGDARSTFALVLADPANAPHVDALRRIEGHYMSTVVSHAGQLLAEGGTEGGVRVDGIGVEAAARLLYATLVEYLGSSATFLDLRDAVRAAALARQRAGASPTECGSALNAFAAAGIGVRDRDLDCFDDAIDDCPDVFDPAQDAPCNAMMCPAVGASCTTHGECCTAEGESCVVGTCERCDGLRALGEACAAEAECCGALTCQRVCPRGSCGSTRACCLRDRDRCTSDGECCGHMRCAGGACACRAAGESCESGIECCGGLFCDAGRCSG